MPIRKRGRQGWTGQKGKLTCNAAAMGASANPTRALELGGPQMEARRQALTAHASAIHGPQTFIQEGLSLAQEVPTS